MLDAAVTQTWEWGGDTFDERHKTSLPMGFILAIRKARVHSPSFSCPTFAYTRLATTKFTKMRTYHRASYYSFM